MAAKRTTRTSKPVQAGAPATASVATVARRVWQPGERRVVRASYDAARHTDENAKLWQYVDGLSAASANTSGIRKIIRDRARYEVANNSYADGICDTLANDTIGPSVQLQLGDTVFAQTVEREFELWANAVNLWGKMRLARRAKAVDGEVFAMFMTNPQVSHEIKLDVRLIECDLIEGWYGNILRDDEIDGIRFDERGNVLQYRMLRSHPGDVGTMRKGGPLAGDWVSARYMRHYFSSTRPGQARGVSELLPALSLFGQLRRYTSAVVECASRAAEISGVLQTDMLGGEAAPEVDALTVVQVERNALLSIPEGWELSQLKAEQPTTTYAQFKSEILNEIARCMSMPFNVAACNSAGYNYASGRLDHQTYDRTLEVERQDAVTAILDPLLAEWRSENATRHSLTEDELAQIRDHEWHFASRDHVDPTKEANADDIRLGNGTLTYAAYWAKRSKDWKREERQRINELVTREAMWNEARAAAGLPPAPYPANRNQQPAAVQDQEPDQDDKPKKPAQDEVTDE